ncbi:hypothetical protein STANM309S_05168 [Streptomyces tanashiensis]
MRGLNARKEKTDQRGVGFDWVELCRTGADWVDLSLPYPPTPTGGRTSTSTTRGRTAAPAVPCRRRGAVGRRSLTRAVPGPGQARAGGPVHSEGPAQPLLDLADMRVAHACASSGLRAAMAS